MSNKKKINDQINKAIATTVVVTAIGISSTINSMPVKALGSQFQRNKSPEMYYAEVESSESSQKEAEAGMIELSELVTQLLKEGNYKEAQEIRRSFTKYINPLASALRSFNNYAVHVV